MASRLSTAREIETRNNLEIEFHSRMEIDHRLDLARQRLYAAIPDSAAWSGAASRSFEARIRELIAELDAIQGGLWH